ncbi:hypothetical protein CHUAL_005727 [Chamberlinius hualienensis]
MDLEWNQLVTAGVLSFLSFVVYLIYNRFQSFTVFNRMNVKGPQPHFFYGNMHKLELGTEKPVEVMAKWQKEYGKVYGYYKGTLPCLVVTDLDLLKKILIRDFSNFSDRYKSAFSLKAVDNSLIGLTGKRWREVRKMLTSTFSAAKMKILVHSMNRSVSAFLSEIEKRVDNEFDIYDLYQRLTVQVICESALALKVNSLSQANEPMFKKVQAFMKSSGNKISSLLLYLPCLVPVFQLLLSNLRIPMVDDIMNNLLEAIKLRRNQTSKVKAIDIIQLMLEMSDTPDEDLAENKGSQKSTKLQNLSSPITDYEIASNCWLFLLAGFETTATALAFLAQTLTMYPKVQEAVYREIVENIPVIELLIWTST